MKSETSADIMATSKINHCNLGNPDKMRLKGLAKHSDLPITSNSIPHTFIQVSKSVASILANSRSNHSYDELAL